ncbi:MAG TPA: polysaccharide biosynthesis/export family protein [Pyrinomonadaceae bacterium]|nr:polysaccharide biosynthesis/export family protein [Pyrinomonadaceae bacterium]
MNFKSISFAVIAMLALPLAYVFAQERVDSPRVQAEAPPSAPPTSRVAARSTSSPPDILIGAGDLLEVSLYGMPDFKTDVRVDSGGEISLPMLGTVAVGSLSIEQAQALIERKLSQKGLFNDPHVTVFEKEYATQGISVLGEVQRPGIYPLLGSRKLYDVISAAGGTTPKAGRYVLITRRNDPQHPVQVPLVTGAPESMENNVPVEPGDTIVVSKAGVVYVVGDVHQPGGFVMENGNDITVLKAIALAQGTNPNAALNSARLIRKTPEGPKDVPLALKQILAVKAPDLQLQADDVVFVPGSAGKSAAKRGAEAILQMATGIAIWRIP